MLSTQKPKEGSLTRAELVVSQGESIQIFELKLGSNIIGSSSKDSNIFINNPDIEKKHVSIDLEQDAISGKLTGQIQALKSTTGTQKKLKDGNFSSYIPGKRNIIGDLSKEFVFFLAKKYMCVAKAISSNHEDTNKAFNTSKDKTKVNFLSSISNSQQSGKNQKIISSSVEIAKNTPSKENLNALSNSNNLESDQKSRKSTPSTISDKPSSSPSVFGKTLHTKFRVPSAITSGKKPETIENQKKDRAPQKQKETSREQNEEHIPSNKKDGKSIKKQKEVAEEVKSAIEKVCSSTKKVVRAEKQSQESTIRAFQDITIISKNEVDLKEDNNTKNVSQKTKEMAYDSQSQKSNKKSKSKSECIPLNQKRKSQDENVIHLQDGKKKIKGQQISSQLSKTKQTSGSQELKQNKRKDSNHKINLLDIEDEEEQELKRENIHMRTKKETFVIKDAEEKGSNIKELPSTPIIKNTKSKTEQKEAEHKAESQRRNIIMRREVQESEDEEDDDEFDEEDVSDCQDDEDILIQSMQKMTNVNNARKKVNIMFSNCDLEGTEIIGKLESLGGRIVWQAETKFDVLVMDEFTKRAKTLVAINRGVPIVSPSWCIESVFQQKLIEDYSLYPVKVNKQFEKSSSFNFNDVLKRRKVTQGQIFHKLKFLLPIELQFPNRQDIEAIISSGGGQMVLEEDNEDMNEVIIVLDKDRSDYLISNSAKKKHQQVKQQLISEWKKEGYTLIEPDTIFESCLQQIPLKIKSIQN